MKKISLGLIVLRTANLHQSLDFYKILGLDFVEEKHGRGPVHYSANLGSSVLELYPGNASLSPHYKDSGTTMLGFQVTALDMVLAELEALNTTVLTPLKHTNLGRRIVVQDPDGRAVELTDF